MAVVLTNQDVCFCRHLDDQNGKHICALDRKHNPTIAPKIYVVNPRGCAVPFENRDIAANMIVNKPSNSKVLSSQIIQPAGSLTSAGLFKIASVRSETVPNN